MPRFFLSAYSIRVKTSRGNAYRTLGNFDLQGANLFQVFSDYLSRRRTIAMDIEEDSGKMLRVSRRRRMQRRHIVKGIIEAGDFGITSRLYDTELGQNSYDRNTVEAELLPYYFLTQWSSPRTWCKSASS